jgi:hypothetical protein
MSTNYSFDVDSYNNFYNADSPLEKIVIDVSSGSEIKRFSVSESTVLYIDPKLDKGES